jgi:hypothetical protein
MEGYAGTQFVYRSASRPVERREHPGHVKEGRPNSRRGAPYAKCVPSRSRLADSGCGAQGHG